MPITLLIADDEDVLLDASMQMILHHLPLVRHVHDGEEAVLLLHQYGSSIDLVVLDWPLRMALFGRELVSALRRAKSDMKLVITTDLMESDVYKELPPGEEPLFLRRPFRREELQEVVHLCLGEGDAE